MVRLTLKSISPQRSRSDRSSTGPVSHAYSFLECLVQRGCQHVRFASEEKKACAHEREIRQMVYPKVSRLPPEIDRRRMERCELVVRDRPKLAPVDSEDLGIQPSRQRRIEQRGIGGVAVEFRRQRDEARAVSRVPSPVCTVSGRNHGNHGLEGTCSARE